MKGPIVTASKSSSDSAQIPLAIKMARIGVHPLGMRRPAEMTELWGYKAAAQLKADLRKLGTADPLRQRKAYRVSVDGYQRLVEAALALHPQAILANRRDGSYCVPDRKDGFYEGDSVYSMSHRVFVPYLPGGFLEVGFSIEGPLDRLQVEYIVQLQHFYDDPAGEAADRSENDRRNAACIAVAEQYLFNAAKR